MQNWKSKSTLVVAVLSVAVLAGCGGSSSEAWEPNADSSEQDAGDVADTGTGSTDPDGYAGPDRQTCYSRPDFPELCEDETGECSEFCDDDTSTTPDAGDAGDTRDLYEPNCEAHPAPCQSGECRHLCPDAGTDATSELTPDGSG